MEERFKNIYEFALENLTQIARQKALVNFDGLEDDASLPLNMVEQLANDESPNYMDAIDALLKASDEDKDRIITTAALTSAEKASTVALATFVLALHDAYRFYV